MSLILALGFLVMVQIAKGFFLNMVATPQRSMTATLGKHGDNFKFLSVFRGKDDEHFPRIIPVAGVFGELSPDDLMAPYSNEASPPGQWSYDFSDSDDPQMGTFACPPSAIITEAADPVGFVCGHKTLGLQLPVEEELECVVVVDRGDLRFDPDSFYVFKTDQGGLDMGTTDTIPDGYEILGKIISTNVPWMPGMKKRPTGFLEDESDY